MSIIMSIASIVFILIFNETTKYHADPYYFVSDSNKILAFINGICFFMFFKNLKIKNSRIINAIASTTFGILLIHANSDAMRKWLWQDILNNTSFFNSKLFWLHGILCPVIVFIVCSGIDYIRIVFLERPLFKLISKKKQK